ncbi:MAG TPA: DUF3313 domain-containing protein, partial [Nitrospira sp.]
GLMVGCVYAALLTACAHSEQAGGYGKVEPSGFLKDYSKLQPAQDDTEASLVYFTQDKVKFKAYTKVWLEPVQVWRGEKSDTKNLEQEDALYVSEYLWSRVDEELRKDYMMTREPGPGVMRIRVGITEAGKGIPVLDNLTAAYPGTLLMSKGKKAIGGTESFVGKASVEVEVTDTQTGELIAEAVDRRGGGKYAWKALHRWEDFEQAANYWAKKFRWRACAMRNEAKCEMPEE